MRTAQADAEQSARMSCKFPAGGKPEIGGVFQLTHTPNAGSGVGQNLYAAGGTGVDAATVTAMVENAINLWYAEGTKPYDYDYTKDPDRTCSQSSPGKTCFADRGHFTALIWDELQSVGFGIARVDCGEVPWYIVVLDFFPPGNAFPNFVSHVPPPVA